MQKEYEQANLLMQGQKEYMTSYLIYFSFHSLVAGVFVFLYSFHAFDEPGLCMG